MLRHERASYERVAAVSKYQWLLFLHIVSVLFLVGGAATSTALGIASTNIQATHRQGTFPNTAALWSCVSHPDPNGPADFTPIEVGEVWENPVSGERATILELARKTGMAAASWK